ncbi:hypothetical protein N7488_006441 [Penicillium malachiteum]|nr:hypothetical protein N7488_006441 [Penicillium malachiteum]
MGHCKSNCPKLERKKSYQQGKNASKTHSPPLRPTGSRLSTSLNRKNDPGSTPPPPPATALESPKVKNSWEIVPTVVFPDIQKTISHLASRLATDSNIYLQRLPYHSVITDYGGPRKMTQMLLG